MKRPKPRRGPSREWSRAWATALASPDPPGLARLAGRNARRLQFLAKLIHTRCAGRAGGLFTMGSLDVSIMFGVSHVTVRAMLLKLEELGVVETLWLGRLVANGADGYPVTNGKRLASRATEFKFLGLPETARGSARL